MPVNAAMYVSTIEQFRHHQGWMMLVWMELLHLDIVPTGTDVPKQFRRGWMYGEMKECDTKHSLEVMKKHDLEGYN